MRLSLMFALLTSVACRHESDQKSEEKFWPFPDSRPSVDELVRPQQENWLDSFIDPGDKDTQSQHFIFGDSLSDPGNLNHRTFGLYLPERVFYHSRFSNGPIWFDYVTAATGWKTINYAVGGAETRTIGWQQRIAIPSFLQQIDENKKDLQNQASPTSRISVWIGANNYFNRGSTAQSPSGEIIESLADSLTNEAIADIKSGVETLIAMGYKNFTLGTVPELGGIIRDPRKPSTTNDRVLSYLTASHNRKLYELLHQLKHEYPTVTWTIFRAYEINALTINEAERFGFRNMQAPCFLGDLRGNFYEKNAYCADPSGYKFWEFVHPNSKMHCYYAAQYLSDVIKEFPLTEALMKCQEL